MGKSPPQIEYTNSQIKKLIQEYIHDEVDRKMLYFRLVHGYTFERISEIVKRDVKTVREHIRDNEVILFKHLP